MRRKRAHERVTRGRRDGRRVAPDLTLNMAPKWVRTAVGRGENPDSENRRKSGFDPRSVRPNRRAFGVRNEKFAEISPDIAAGAPGKQRAERGRRMVT